MINNYDSFEKPEVRGKYARDISWLLGENNLNWKASASVVKAEVFIKSKDSTDYTKKNLRDPPEEKYREVSRVSLQIKDGSIHLGVSGTQPHRAREIIRNLGNRGYWYHDKGYTEDGRPRGRWWMVKSFYNIESIVNEFKEIEPIILQK
jgi:hypothetical protein